MSIQEVQLPEIGEGVTEGEMVRWLVGIGDRVEVDQAVAEMMTDKATVEVPTPFSGEVKELKVKAGDIVPIKSTILLLDVKEDEAQAQKTEAQKKEDQSEAANKGNQDDLKEKTEAQEVFSNHSHRGEMEWKGKDKQDRILAAPYTRRLARELNVDLGQIKGTGLAGRIRREDVLSQASENKISSHKVVSENKDLRGSDSEPSSLKTPLFPPLNLEGEISSFELKEREKRVPLRGVRRKISVHMKESKLKIPHFTVVEAASVSELIRVRKDAQQKAFSQNIKLTYLPFIVKALTQTLKEHPIFNASLDEQKDEILYKNYFNIGIAVSTEQGLMVPNIKEADKKSVLRLAYEIHTLAVKAREFRLSLDELKNGTFTLSNIGSVGGLLATPIIYHPEVAILGMYKIENKIVLKEKNFSVDPSMNFSITCDHRLIDGAIAAQFLNSFVSKIENPSLLLLEMV